MIDMSKQQMDANGMKLNQQSELGHGGIIAPKREKQHTVVPI